MVELDITVTAQDAYGGWEESVEKRRLDGEYIAEDITHKEFVMSSATSQRRRKI